MLFPMWVCVYEIHILLWVVVKFKFLNSLSMPVLLFHFRARKKKKGILRAVGLPSEDLKSLFRHGTLFSVADTEDIYICWAHHEQLIHFLCQEYPSFLPYLPVPFVYLINSHVSLTIQLSYYFPFTNFPGDKAEWAAASWVRCTSLCIPILWLLFYFRQLLPCLPIPLDCGVFENRSCLFHFCIISLGHGFGT